MKYCEIWREEKEKARAIKYKGVEIARVKYSNTVTGKPCAIIWKSGKSLNPISNYSYRNNTQRFRDVLKTIKNIKKHIEWKQEYKAKVKLEQENAVKNSTIKKGDLYYCSWGYDQTNYDFIVVLGVSKTGKTVTCQRTSALHMGQSSQCDVLEPIFCPFGDVFNLQVRAGYLTGSYPFCNDGSMEHTRMGHFSKHQENNQYFETMAEFGH